MNIEVPHIAESVRISGLVHTEAVAVAGVDFEGNAVVGIKARYSPHERNATQSSVVLSPDAARSLLADLQAAIALIDGSIAGGPLATVSGDE